MLKADDEDTTTLRTLSRMPDDFETRAFALLLYDSPKLKHHHAMQFKQLAVLLFISLLAGCATPATGGQNLKTCNNAVAKSDERRWYTADDLPTDWVYNNVPTFRSKGRFELEVNNIGKVIRCVTSLSSQAKIIDQSICSILKRRAAFNSVPKFCADTPRYVTYRAILAWNLKSDGTPRVSLKRTSKT